jgi:F0F1-type ATP synthase assembly protein I
VPKAENDKPKPLFSRIVKARQTYYSATTIPYIFIAYPLAGLIIGWWLDSKLKTAPWILLFFFFVGMVEAFREMIRIAKGAERQMEEEDKRSREESKKS